MSRFVSVTLVFAALAALVGAQGPTPALAPPDQARLLKRNRDLLNATVDSSLDLTDNKGPLERAGACNKLVKVWAAAVEQAVRDHDAARASEMGGLLNKVADYGVAENLRIARQKIQPDSPMERDLFKHRNDAREEIDRLTSVLVAASSRDLQPLIDALKAARAHIIDAADLPK
jgi:hypothetical protein